MLRPFVLLVSLILTNTSLVRGAITLPEDSVFADIKTLPDTAKVTALLAKSARYHQYFYRHNGHDVFLDSAIALATRIGYREGLAKAYNQLGVTQRDHSHYFLAVELHKKALAIADELHDEQLKIICFNNIGVAYRRLDNNQNAFEYHFKALQAAESIKDLKNIAIATNSIGNIYLALGKYREAISQLQRSLKIEKQRKNVLGMAINYANIGEGYQGLHDIGRAISYYKKSLQYNSEIPDNTTGLAICYNLLGGAYAQKKDFKRALYFLATALSINDKVQDRIHVANNYISIGKIFAAENNYKEAVKNINKGLKIAKQISSKSMAMEALLALSDVYQQQGRYKESLQSMHLALNYKDSIINEKSAMRLAQLQALYELDKKDNQIELLQQQNKIKELKMTRSSYFTLFVILFCMLILAGGYYYMRHRELKANKKSLQLELESLRTQMNPHFIFNSLNSIHHFIWNNKQEAASEYLTKFSQLMRMILEHTRHASIPLREEIESITLYLDLESMRCNYCFSYSIDIDPAIDRDYLLIPPLIIQPFIENAIWHGLVHKDEDEPGLLKIRLLLKKEIVLCEIDDNGIGRQKAIEIKAAKQMRHESIGMRVTEDRVMLLKEIMNSKKTGVEIIDKKDEQGKAIGTKAMIMLPVDFLY